MPILQTEARIQNAFPGGPTPAQVVVKAINIATPAIRGALSRFRTRALATGLVHEPISIHVINRQVAIISAPLAGTGKDTRSNKALQTLRSDVIPATLAETAGVQTVAVGGQTASSKDYKTPCANTRRSCSCSCSASRSCCCWSRSARS
jgi:RND superfamily putative drug exporter